MKAIFLLAAVALVGCGEASSPTSVKQQTPAPAYKTGDVITNDRTPVELVITACNGETVAVTGDQQFVIQITNASNGTVHSKVTSHYTFTGVGSTTGAKYEGGMRFTDHEIINQNGVTVFNVESSFRLIGQGNVPNTWVDFSTDFTINSNGALTHQNSPFSERCT